MTRIAIFAGALLTVLVLLLASACDSDNPIQTQPQASMQEQDYVVWMYNRWRPQELWGYHPATGTIDTLLFADSVANPPYRITVSHDGMRLYALLNSQLVRIFEMPGLSVLGDISVAVGDPVIVSPDGQYFAIAGPDLYIYSTDDLSVVFHDTSQVRHNGVFAADGQTFYGMWSAGPLPGQYVYRLSLDSNPATTQTQYLIDGRPVQVLPTPDQSKWLLYKGGGGSGGFLAYDALQNSVIFQHDLCPGLGEIVMTPDGRWAFYTNPGGGFYPLGESIIRMFDIENNRVVEEIVTNAHGDSTAPAHCPIQQMVVTPDGRYLVGLDYPGYNQLICYDITNRTLTDYRYFGANANISNLTVQLAP
ncbi:MAG: hypothetical protein ABIE70_02750 [bacterium]